MSRKTWMIEATFDDIVVQRVATMEVLVLFRARFA